MHAEICPITSEIEYLGFYKSENFEDADLLFYDISNIKCIENFMEYFSSSENDILKKAEKELRKFLVNLNFVNEETINDVLYYLEIIDVKKITCNKEKDNIFENLEFELSFSIEHKKQPHFDIYGWHIACFKGFEIVNTRRDSR